MKKKRPSSSFQLSVNETANMFEDWLMTWKKEDSLLSISLDMQMAQAYHELDKMFPDKKNCSLTAYGLDSAFETTATPSLGHTKTQKGFG